MKKKQRLKNRKLISLLIFLAAILIFFIIGFLQQVKNTSLEKISEEYNPEINPDKFTSLITNKYLALTPGKKMVYESKTEDGIEKIEVYVTNEKKLVMGVETAVVWDRVWLNDELIEDTKDWYAQDKEGNVWYFGEYSETLVNGKVAGTKGSWEAGVDNAKPGILMKANPKIGEKYNQEYYKGEAEDKAEIASLNEDVSVSFGEFNNCLKTIDYTPLEPDAKEYKYYCMQVKGLVLEVDAITGEKAELISVNYNEEPFLIEKEPERLETKITEEEAIKIALKKVPGKVTNVAIEKKFDRPVYVVEIDADKGPETDVIIDINTGEILYTER